VLDILERYTMFPWPLLKTQTERVLLDPVHLDADALALVLDDLARSLARFTSVDRAEHARNELNELLVTLRTRP
jgi:hypothetical protein